MFAGRFVENLDVFEIGMRAETGVGWECPWSGGPVWAGSAHASRTQLEWLAYHANKHVFGSSSSGNVTTTAGS